MDDATVHSTYHQYDENMLASRFINSSIVDARCQLIVIFTTKLLVKSVVQPHSLPIERVLDMGCGDGSVTRALVHDGIANFAMGIDVSMDMIRLAENATQHEKESFQYFAIKAEDLTTRIETIGKFPIVISTNVLCHLENTDELYQMLLRIRRVCIGHFVGIIPSPFSYPNDEEVARKYGIKAIVSPQRIDGDKIHVTFHNNTPDEFSLIDFYYSSETYERLFRKAGFATFQWIPAQIDPQAEDGRKEFFADMCQLYMGFIAGI